MVQTLLRSTPLRVWGEVSVRLPSRKSRATLEGPRNRRESTDFWKIVEDGNSQSDSPDPSHELAFAERFHQPVFGLQYYEILASSKMTFNSHIDARNSMPVT